MANLTQAQRDKLPAEDFAGPGRSFPITDQEDVDSAARLLGHAADPEAVKRRIIAIAKRKGLRIPDAWMAPKETGTMFERKAYTGAAEVKGNEDEGRAHLLVSVFSNVDSDEDVMEPGAFLRDIEAGKAANRLPKGVWAHDWKTPVAVTLDAWEEKDGLHVDAQFAMWKQIGRDAFADIKHGLIDEYSFGFKVRDSERKESRRHIKDVAWFEWSPVLVGANRETRTIAVKSGEEPSYSDTAALARVAEIVKAGTLLPEQIQALLGLGDTSASPAGLTFEDHSSKVLADLGAFAERVRDIRDLREKQGRRLSAASRERLRSIFDGLGQMTELLEALLTETDPAAPSNVNAAMQQFARMQANRARMNGINL